MKFEDSYLYTALVLVNAALEEDDNGIFSANDACRIAVPKVSNLGLARGPLWDERGQQILLTAWGQNRHHFIAPVKEEPAPEPPTEEFPSVIKTPLSRKFPTVVKWPAPFNTLVVLHCEGETGLHIRYGDLLRANAQAALDYRTNQLAGRRENLDGGYGKLVDRLPADGKTRVYDILKNDLAAAAEILRHIEKTER